MQSTLAPAPPSTQLTLIRWLTYLMFTMFALTTDSVGVIIPRIIKEFNLTLTQASAFHYATMSAIAVAGISLGFLADRLGRKRTIMLGLTLFAISAGLFAAGNTFVWFVGLLLLSGLAIGVFKTGALALIGDISSSTSEHTSIMNTVEGFFGVGAIIGPALVTQLLANGASWKNVYLIAAGICVILLVIAAIVRYPQPKRAASAEPVSFAHTLTMLGNPYALGFSLGTFLYVAVECAIYVWMPTLLEGYRGPAVTLAAYSLSVFFILRASGRFLGAFLLQRFEWSRALMILSFAIFLCFLGSLVGGVDWAVYLLPLSGLFFSVIYPTLNSKGISCFPKNQHGAVSGVILFFTCVAAAGGPFAMGAVSDYFGSPRYGFYLATGFAACLFFGLLYNGLRHPAEARLRQQDQAPTMA